MFILRSPWSRFFYEFRKASGYFFEKWEHFKEDFKIAAVSGSSELQFLRKQHKRTLEHNPQLLFQAECDHLGLGLKGIVHVKEQINEICHDKYQGAVAQSRAESYLLGEQPRKL